MPTQEELAAMQLEANALYEASAPASAFEALRKRGWHEASYGQGTGIPPCDTSCGVCYPQYTPRRRRTK